MPADRHLQWDGCFNVRDLGGLHTSDGRETLRGAIVRADGLNRLTVAGWQALEDYGIRTIVDLRNDDEVGSDTALRPTGLTTVRVPLDDSADVEMWQRFWDDELDGSPLYYQPFLDRKPERCAAAIAAIARARPGGVVFHCGAGRDRTGLVSLLVLSLVGVRPDEIVADYKLSNPRLPGLWVALGLPDQAPEIEAILARRNTSAADVLHDILGSLDPERFLLAAGAGKEDLTALRSRLLAPA